MPPAAGAIPPSGGGTGPVGIALLSIDLDGTLVHTAPEIALAVNGAFAARGLRACTVAEVELGIGHGAAHLVRRLVAAASPPPSVAVDETELIADVGRRLEALAGSVARPYPGTVEALQRLADGGVRLACTTNKVAASTRRMLEALGLSPFFALVTCGDTLPVKKPDGAVLRHVAARLGVPLERTAHVGDSATDVFAAKNAPCAAWAVAHGYDGGVPIASAAPEHVFTDLSAVAAHVLATRAGPHSS